MRVESWVGGSRCAPSAASRAPFSPKPRLAARSGRVAQRNGAKDGGEGGDVHWIGFGAMLASHAISGHVRHARRQRSIKAVADTAKLNFHAQAWRGRRPNAPQNPDGACKSNGPSVRSGSTRHRRPFATSHNRKLARARAVYKQRGPLCLVREDQRPEPAPVGLLHRARRSTAVPVS